MLRWLRVCAVLAAASLPTASLTACAVSTPFTGPGKRGVIDAADHAEKPVTVSITHITLKSDSAARGRFWRSVHDIDSAIRDQPGFIGYAKRTELFGDESWTVSAWDSEASMLAFIRSPAHSMAMERAADSFEMARFARVSVPAGRLPLAWPEILELLARNERKYYE